MPAWFYITDWEGKPKGREAGGLRTAPCSGFCCFRTMAAAFLLLFSLLSSLFSLSCLNVFPERGDFFVPTEFP